MERGIGIRIVKAPELCRYDRKGKLADIVRLPQGPGSQPVVMKPDTAKFLAIVAEGVDIGIAHASPVDEFDTDLVRRMGLAHELMFVDAETLIEKPEVRKRGLTDANPFLFVQIRPAQSGSLFF